MNLSRPPHTAETRAREAQADFMQDSVQKVEKYFGQLCNNMGGITRKTARLRDKYDLLAKTCLDFANKEQGHLSKKLVTFAEQVSNVQDYRQAEIDRLQAKVVDPLLTYGPECKHTKTDLNKSFKARKQEIRQQQKVVNIHNKSPGDHHAITRAEAELQKKALDVARSTRALEETIDKFEVKKIQDLKKILTEFVKIEMVFHAKALEVYTEAFKNLSTIEEEEHIEVFRNSLRFQSSNLQERLDLVKDNADKSLTESTPSPRPRNNQGSSRRKHSSPPREEEFVDEEWGSDEETEDDEDYYDDDDDNFIEDEYQPRRKTSSRR